MYYYNKCGYMKVRLAEEKDINKIIDIYTNAVKFMRSYGNDKQWINGYPGLEDINIDILNKNLYVVENNDIIGVFALVFGKDESYDKIYDGNWINDNLPYATIHRIANNGEYKGILSIATNYALTKINNIRIDTHEINIPMIKSIQKNGYKKCGTIYLKKDGSPRLVYQLLKEE